MVTEIKEKLIDPVCGQEVSLDSSFRTYYGNGVYFFCSAEHKKEFDEQPEKYTREETTFTGGSCD